jgi:Subtilase family
MPEPPNKPPSPWTQRILRKQLDEELRKEAGKRLRDRRANKPGAVKFDEIVDNAGRTVPVAADRLLIRTADLTSARKRLLADRGLTTEPVPGLDGRVQRITLPGKLAGQVKETHRELRGLDVPVSPVAITPMGAGPSPTVVWKTLCSPEPVATPLFGAPTPAATPPKVTVIDTGVTAEKRTDGWLTGLAHANGDNVDPLDVYPTRNDFLDLAAGHGTFVAGIIQRLAPTVQLEVVRALDSDGITDETVVAAAMVAAARGGADVLNLSLGAETYDGGEPIALVEALAMIGEIEQQAGREIAVVAAAGNSGTVDPVFPAALAGVIAVAALTPVGDPAPWSSRGSWVDCCAVGEQVVSTYVEGKEDPFVRFGSTVPVDPPDEYGPNSWAIWNGTSFAAPQVAARIARTAQEDGTGARTAARKLLGSAVRSVPDYGVVID